MRFFLTLLALICATPIEAQPVIQPAWNPTGPYITPGQDEPGYRSWYLALPSRAVHIKAFNDYLATYEVAGIVPTWQLLRTATSWRECAGQPFELPPTSEWPHIVQTLRYVRDYVIPAVGPVEPVSGYRNPVLNVCAGGAPESAHKHYSAIDLVPLRPTTRVELMRTLCAVHGRRGLAYEVGLGFYAFLRFHVDTSKYRRWNMDPAVANECPPIVRPVVIASAKQPTVSASSAPPAAAATAVPTPPATTDPPILPADIAPPAVDPLAPQR